MAAAEEAPGPASAASVVMGVLRLHGPRLNDAGMEMRRTEEAAARRHEAAGWLRSTVGAACAKDLPAEPSEEEFRRGVRGGFLLCNALNRVLPGAVPKVVECPADSVVLHEDGTALLAYQYFENIRNFFVAAQELGIPLFEASDLEEGGKIARVVNCVLALKSYSEWKQSGGIGAWKYSGSCQKPASSGKFLARRNTDFLFNSSSRSAGSKQSSNTAAITHQESQEQAVPRSLNSLVRAVISDKKPEELPMLLESILIKVMEEFDCSKTTVQSEPVSVNARSLAEVNKSTSKRKALAELAIGPIDAKTADENVVHDVENANTKPTAEEIKARMLKQKLVVEKQQNLIEELKQTVTTTRVGMQYLQLKYSEEFCNLGMHLKNLSQAASGYHKVLAENRKLYNQVQDLKGSIRVYCRVRPFLPGQSRPMSSTVGHLDEGSISIITPSKYGKEGRKSFNFNKVFGPSATQDEVFLDTQPLIRSVLDGYNVCIFAYGQTGSGKTYTMTGPKDLSEETQGVNYRALGDLFQIAEERRDAFRYEISVQMIEIYNEQVRDLLSGDSVGKRLEIRNSSQNGVNVPDAALVRVASTSDVIELMNVGQQNRSVGATALNDRSSRSHSCLTVHVQGRELASGTILRGSMHLVDLAGSERVNKSEVTGERLKEAQHINKSLSALGDVIAALAQKSSHVPYRNSKLTQLLQDSLGGQAKTLMFVHISPESDAAGETISTLKFAERVSSVELGAAHINKESAEVRDLKEQIVQLKEALANKEGADSNHQRPARTPVSGVRKVKSSSPGSTVGSEQRVLPRKISDQRSPEENTEKSRFDSLPIADDTLSWPDSVLKGEEKEMSYQNWVDKIMVSKQEARDDEDSASDRHSESLQLPDSFFQRYNPDTRIFQDSRSRENRELDAVRIQALLGPTDESDECDIGTSDSSDADLVWPCSATTATTKSASAVTRSVTRLKKPQARPPISPDTRTPARGCGPSPSARKAASQTPNRGGRPAADAVRQSSIGKPGSKKQ